MIVSLTIPVERLANIPTSLSLEAIFVYGYFQKLYNAPLTQSLQHEGRQYVWMDYDYLNEAVPLLHGKRGTPLSLRTLTRLSTELVEAGLLVRYPNNKKKQKAFFAFGPVHWQVVHGKEVDPTVAPPPRETKKNKAKVKHTPELLALAQEVYAILNQFRMQAGFNPCELTEKRLQQIQTLIAQNLGISSDGTQKQPTGLLQFKAVLEYKKPWLSDDKMKIYFQPNTLFRTSNFTKYLTEARENYQPAKTSVLTLGQPYQHK